MSPGVCEASGAPDALGKVEVVDGLLHKLSVERFHKCVLSIVEIYPLCREQRKS